MRKEASLEQWRYLFNIGLMIRDMEPWKDFDDMDIITIELPGYKEPFFCSFLGAGDQCFGVNTFIGYDGLRSFLSIVDSENCMPIDYIMIEQTNLACFFGNREMVPESQKKIMKDLGLKFRGKNNWIYFQSYKKGHIPFSLDEDEANILVKCLEQLTRAILDYKTQNIKVDFEKGDTLVRRFKKKKEQWNTERDVLAPFIYGYPSLILKDEILGAKLKKSLRVDSILEIDMIYIKVSIEEDINERPIRPKLLLILDHYNGMIVGHQFLTPGNNEIAAVMELFINLLLKGGRPMEILLRNPLIESILKDTCEKCGIKLTMKRDLEVVDAFMNDFEVLGF